MLTRLKRASRRRVALIWAVALVFALAPAVSMACASPVGAFSRLLAHAHANDVDGHVHHGHHHHHGHGHDQHDGHHDHDAAIYDGQPDDQGQQRLHVHYDACCPSAMVPTHGVSRLQHRVADRIAILRVEPMQGAPPDRLLRPPIPSSLL